MDDGNPFKEMNIMEKIRKVKQKTLFFSFFYGEKNKRSKPEDSGVDAYASR